MPPGFLVLLLQTADGIVGGQSWLQPAFQASPAASKPDCRQNCLPHLLQPAHEAYR